MNTTERQIPIPAASERHAWARSELGLPEDSQPRAARRRFLERLREREFVPQESLVEAWEQLERQGTSTDSADRRLPMAFAYERPRQLLDEVEKFAKVFFDLKVSERESRYRRLALECQCWPAVQARLLRLRSAQKLTWPDASYESSDVQQILGWIRELYILAGPPSVARRQAILAEMAAAKIFPIAVAGRRLREKFGDVRALMPSFIAALDTQLVASKEEPADVVFVDQPASPVNVTSTWTPNPALPQVTPIPYTPYEAPSWNWGGSRFVVGIVIFLAIAFFNMMRAGSNNRPNTPVNYPTYTPSYNPSTNPAQSDELRRILDDIQKKNENLPPFERMKRFEEDDPDGTSPLSLPPELDPSLSSPFAPTPATPRAPERTTPGPVIPGPRIPSNPNPGGSRFP